MTPSPTISPELRAEFEEKGFSRLLAPVSLLRNRDLGPEILSWVADREAKAREEEREQKHYEIAMLAQSVVLFMEKDEEEYGATPLHGKFKAFWDRYIVPLLSHPKLSEKTGESSPLEEGVWKGKRIKEMSRPEIIEAWQHTDALYRRELSEGKMEGV